MISQDGHVRDIKILVINPNSSKALTMGLEKMIGEIGCLKTTTVHAYTAPSGPDSINNEDDARISADVVFEDIIRRDYLSQFNGIVVACYSVHPLTRKLASLLSSTRQVQVIGIFEASILTALSLLQSPTIDSFERFGIVTTGKYWEDTLTRGVLDFLECDSLSSCRSFKGVESTGLSAAELHSSQPSEVRSRMIEATKRLVKDRDIGAICLGCAGMTGMDAIVRDACVEELGENMGGQVHIIDGVRAAIILIESRLRNRT